MDSLGEKSSSWIWGNNSVKKKVSSLEHATFRIDKILKSMCGIFGFFSKHKEQDIGVLEHRLRRSQRALHHRGPDDHGLESFELEKGRLWFGHTRLAIIDLSRGGHQPMRDGRGRYSVVFNGEIYNYQELRKELKKDGRIFRTESDTEVLVNAWAEWGVDSLKRFAGMFAFAVFDRVEETITIARDGFGIKPLFYSIKPGEISFASEIPALSEINQDQTEINWQRACDYLLYGRYDDQAETFFSGVVQLPPGHFMTIHLNKVGNALPQRWWWPSIEERSGLTFTDAADQLRDLFLASIRLHLRSDVPIGAALSGGIDSSAIVCSMRFLEPDMDLHTFSYVARGSQVNEEDWIDLVNRASGAIPHKIEIEPGDLFRDLKDLIRTQGEPFGGTSIYAQYRIYRSARENNVIVTLDGQGADEALAGYLGYPEFLIRSMWDKGEHLRSLRVLAYWMSRPGRGIKSALYHLGSAALTGRLRQNIRTFAQKGARPVWINAQHLRELGVKIEFPDEPEPQMDGHGRRLVEKMRSVLCGSNMSKLLRHGDRNSMRWSVESRVPFLNKELIEFLLTLPESFLLSHQGETKSVFRAAMRGIVPDAILDRQDKIGFSTPQTDWLRLESKNLVDVLSRGSRLPIFRDTEFRKVAKEARPPAGMNDERLWRVLNFCEWAR